MPGKARVHELAKELGVTSKELLAVLRDQGEFVKSASSTVEAPVARRIRETFSAKDEGGSAGKTTAKAAPIPSRPKSAVGDSSRTTTTKPKPSPVAKSSAKPNAASQTKPGTPSGSAQSTAPKPGAARRGAHKPGSAQPNVAEPGEVKPSTTKTSPIKPGSVQSKSSPARASVSQNATAEFSASDEATAKRTPGTSSSATDSSPVSDQDKPKTEKPKATSAKPGPRQPRVGNNPFSAPAVERPVPRPMPRPGQPRPGQPRPGQGGSGQNARSGSGQRSNAPRPGQPRQGQPRPGQPRPGQPRGAARPGQQQSTGQGSSRSGQSSASTGIPRPNPMSMPQHSTRPDVGRPGGRPSGGNRGNAGAGGGSPYRGGTPAASGSGPAAGGGAGRGGRSGGRRGGTAGAFGRPGGAPRRGRKSKRQKRQEYDAMQAPSVSGVQLPRGNGQTVRLARGASLADFADKIDANPAALVQVLFNLGEMVTATQSVPDEILEILGEEMNFKVEVVSPEDEDRELLKSFDLQFGEDAGDDSDLVQRPPVVTVMGHVDHGKTRLLDTIRKTNVGGHEAGGITQHIGAYQVTVHLSEGDRTVTFIDTPGHEAFTAMRARGAMATDIAIVVVAADDGVMPQTVEAINHATAADIPIVVAVNKIDKEGADPEKIRGQLTEYGLVPEEYGGDTMFVDISAKQGINIDRLLEAVILTADASLDLRANPNMDAQGVAIEAHLDRGRGPVATVLVQRGTLHVGDSIVVGDAYGRVRRMLDEYGHDVIAALPSRPVQVIGLTSVSGAGDNLLVVEEDRIARQIAGRRDARRRNALAARNRKRVSLEDLDKVLKETSQLNLILKGDNAGTVEALESSLLAIQVDDEVELQIIDRGVGAVTETNVNLAAASNAVIIGFNVRAEGKATEKANHDGVEIRYYSVIYQAIDDIEAALKGMLKPVYEEKELGHASVRALFKSSKFGTIAGCMVVDGLIRRNAQARIIRDGKVVIDNTQIKSLRREKDDASEVRQGFECGLTTGYSDIRVGDTIETYEMIEKAR